MLLVNSFKPVGRNFNNKCVNINNNSRFAILQSQPDSVSFKSLTSDIEKITNPIAEKYADVFGKNYRLKFLNQANKFLNQLGISTKQEDGLTRFINDKGEFITERGLLSCPDPDMECFFMFRGLQSGGLSVKEGSSLYGVKLPNELEETIKKIDKAQSELRIECMGNGNQMVELFTKGFMRLISED